MPESKSITITKSTRIGVLYGGLSSEREVSLVSGKACYEALLRLGYTNCVLIDVGRDIASRLQDEKIDVAYLALHGRYGEDGCIQGVLEILGIPYTGCRVTASALTMNKALTKSILKDAGLPIIQSHVLKRNGSHALPAGFPFPLMVKPLNEGSSYGMSKVDRPEDLPQALATAFEFDHEVMVEAFVKGQSITVGVVNVDGAPTVTPILELRPTKSEWYDLEAKYTKGLTEFILPAEIDDATTRAIQKATLDAHKAAGCHGMSRIDFMVAPDNKFYILEINTIPGMTPLSDLPAQAQAIGIGYDQLVEYILKSAC